MDKIKQLTVPGIPPVDYQLKIDFTEPVIAPLNERIAQADMIAQEEFNGLIDSETAFKLIARLIPEKF
jgi:hypothetical protein